MFSKSAAFVVLAAAVSSQAQTLSAGCTGAVAQLAFGNLGQCLQLTSALGLISGGSSGSIIDPLNSYLQSFCADSTPTCTNETLTSAQSSIESSCASDLQATGNSGGAATVLEALLQSYPQVKTAACSRNTTTNEFCVVNTLSTVQNVSGTDVGLSYFTGLIGAGSAPDALTQVAQSGQLCTGCNQEIWSQANIADPSFANSTFGQAVSQQCGANFATNSTPTGVANPSTSAAATSNAAGSASASPSGAAGLTKNTDFVPYLFTAGSLLAGLAIGGATLF